MSNMVAKKTCGRSHGDHPDSCGLYASDGERKYLNLAERKRALAVMETLEPDEALFAMTLAWTGARVSEVLSLTPASFQLENGVVAIVTLKRRRFSVREVPLPATLITAIDEQFGLRAAQADPVVAGSRIWTWRRETAWRLIKSVMRHSAIVGLRACPRGLRHGFGVGALQSGVPINLVQRWLGHARLSTTAIYANASGPEEMAFASRFWQL